MYNLPSPIPLQYVKRSIVHEIDGISDRMIESALSNFPVLEEFSLIGASSLVRNITICCNTLKKLEILECMHLRKLELIAPELVCFTYKGLSIEYVFRDVPNLVEYTLLDPSSDIVTKNDFVQLKPILDQFVKVNFVLDFPWESERHPLIGGEFSRVKELQIDVRIWESGSPLILFDNVLRLVPNADAVSLRLFWPQKHEAMDTYVKEFYHGVAYHDVGVFEYDGYRGNSYELEVIKVLIKAAKSLKKVVVRVGKRVSLDSDEDYMDAIQRETAVNSACKYIKPALIPGTAFEVL